MNHSVEDTETNSVTLQEENQQALPEAGRVDMVRWKFTVGPSFKHLFLKKKRLISSVTYFPLALAFFHSAVIKSSYRAACFANLKKKMKGADGLIMAKASATRISIPLDLSCRSFIPLPRFIRSRRPTPLLAPCLLLFPPRVLK